MTDTVYISFNDKINLKSTHYLIAACNEAINKHQPKNIYILFCSPGGDITQALFLFSYIKGMPTNVVMHGTGIIDSCAFNAFLSGTERYASDGTTFLLHPATKVYSKDVSLTKQQLELDLMSLKMDQQKVVSNILENTKFTETEILNYINSGIVLDVEMAREKGVIHNKKAFSMEPNSIYLQASHFSN